MEAESVRPANASRGGFYLYHRLKFKRVGIFLLLFSKISGGDTIPEFEHKLRPYEVKYGLISVKGIRKYFPPPNEKIDIYDDKRRKYTTKMHASAARIDGLTEWHKNQLTGIGDTVVIKVKYEIYLKKR